MSASSPARPVPEYDDPGEVVPFEAVERERHGTLGAKSDAGDAHTLADMVRTDRHQLRAVAGDSEQARAVKVVARAHQTLIWERQRHMLRHRHQPPRRAGTPGAVPARAPGRLVYVNTLMGNQVGWGLGSARKPHQVSDSSA